MVGSHGGIMLFESLFFFFSLSLLLKLGVLKFEDWWWLMLSRRSDDG